MTERIPSNLRYTKDHEWARVESDGSVTVGITAHAVKQLGDITLVTLPAVGTAVTAHQHFGDVDSVKAVSDLLSPLDGEVSAVNDALVNTPETLNDDPYADGWMIRVKPSNPGAIDELLTAEQYEQYLADNS